MLGKLIGAVVGEKVAEQTDGIGGVTGAVLGVVAATVLRRMSLPVLLVVGLGGYVLSKRSDKRLNAEKDAAANPAVPPN